MRRFVSAAVLLPALLCLSLTGVAHADPLVSLSGNDAPLTSSTRIHDVDGGQQTTAALSLKLHNQQALQQFLADVQNPASPRR